MVAWSAFLLVFSSGASPSPCWKRLPASGFKAISVPRLSHALWPVCKRSVGYLRMTFSEAETLFHEFGHGLQHMLTHVEEPCRSASHVL